MNRFLFILIIAQLLSLPMLAQNVKKDIRSGNKAYEEGDFQNAELQYRKALENVEGNNQTALYNLGNALYRQENFDAASGSWAMAADQYDSPEKKADAAFNLGNAMMKTQKYPEAISSFKEALRNNPEHDDARYNLEYAKKMLQKQQQQQNQDQQNQDQQNQDQQNQDQQNQEQQNQEQQNQDQQNQDQQNQDQQNQDQQNQEQQNQDPQNQDPQNREQQNQDQQPQEISKEDAQRMLEALKQGEKETMEKLNKKKVKASRVKIEKDW